MSMRTLTCGFVVFLAACSSDLASVTQAAGETCPAGQKRWAFSDRLPASWTSLADTQQPDASTYKPRFRNVITEVTSFSCRSRQDDGGVAYNSNGAATATAVCRDLTQCFLKNDCVDPVERLLNSPRLSRVLPMELAWKCADGSSHYAEDGADTVWLACPDALNVREPADARIACVPTVCNGATRRGADLSCVPDLARPLVREEDIELTQFDVRGKFMPFETNAAGTAHGRTGRSLAFAELDKRLEIDQLSRIRASVVFRRNTRPPPSAKMALWMSEVHDDAIDGGARGTSSAATESFRCLVKTFDVGYRQAADGGLDRGSVVGLDFVTIFDEDLVIPPDCFNESIAYQQQWVFRQPKVDGQELPRKRVRSLKFHLSYDMDNASIFVPKGKSRADACAADPVEFYYQRATDLYDLQGFYKQREVAKNPGYGSTRYYSDGSSRFFVATDGYFIGSNDVIFYPSDRVEMGLSDVRVDKPVTTIKVNSRARQKIDVSGDFYRAFDPVYSFSGYVAKYMKTKLRVFLVPRGSNGEYVAPGAEGFTSIGAVDIPMGRDGKPIPGPQGVTISGRFLIDSTLKAAFLNPSSSLYVSEGRRTFEVVGCVEARSDSGDYWINSEFWATPNYRYNRQVIVGNDAAAEAAYKPPGFPSPGRGCRWSKAPLVIVIDKSISTVEPIDSILWDGQGNTEEQGNSSVKQTNDNDADRTCQATDAGTPRCDQGSGAGQKGKGDYGKSYYATSTSSAYTPGSFRMQNGQPADDSEAAGGAEVLGYQVLDPEADSEMKQWEFNPVSKVQKVNLTITPPWDNIWAAIKQANQGNLNPEWVKGRYAGLQGLGVGWGYKQPVGSFGIVTFTISVGFSLALIIGVSHTQNPDDLYKCIVPTPAAGTTPSACVQLGSEEKSFTDAVTDCGTRGARLAELSTLNESALLETLLNGPSSPGEAVWVGAQQADEYNPGLCLGTWLDSVCRPNHKTQFRWLSNDATFASTTGGAAGTIDTTAVYFSGGIQNGLFPRAPAKAGVIFNRDGSLSSDVATAQHPYACMYDPAERDIPIKVEAAVELGFAVGVGIEWCFPSDEIGICLAGTLNLAALKIAPKVETVFHHLRDHRGRTSRRDNTNLSAEWSVTLLEGSVEAKFKALIFEFSIVILEFGGFSLGKDKLFDFNFPSMEPFR